MEAVKARTKPFLMAGLPLRLCYAVTIHKAQGMTVPEGMVIDWKSKMPLASLVGLPFVAMTRAQTVTKVAVKNLPEYVNFLQPRDSKQFKFRKIVEDRSSVRVGMFSWVQREGKSEMGC